MSHMAVKAGLLVDGTASRWLVRVSGNAVPRAEDLALFRRLVLAGLAGLATVPTLLSLAVNPALALPVGAALVFAAFLLSVAAFFAMPRPAAAGADIGPEREAAAFDLCPGLAILLDPQGQVTETGGRDRAAFPMSMREAVGLPLAERVHVSDRIALMQALDALRLGAPSALADIRIERPYSAAGRQFLPVRLDMTAVRDTRGELVRIFAQARDISEEQDLRAEAEERQSEAKSAHEAKLRFLAAVSHELRTPLNAILGFSDVLAGEYFGRLENDRQREYVGLIRQSGRHLLSVVNTMLDMSKIEAGRYEVIAEPFVLSEAMETCRAMLDLSARGKGVTLASRASRGLGEIHADRRAVQQILINLASNAIKFTGSGGVVSMDAAMSGGDVVICVSDTGIGIPPDRLASLGQPFTQVENDYSRSYEGTGLGLSLVKGLVALHGGRFSIASKPGEGTVVTVTLPADGSGIGGKPVDAGEEKVEFPPRLVTVRHAPMTDEQDRTHAPAQAKIA